MKKRIFQGKEKMREGRRRENIREIGEGKEMRYNRRSMKNRKSIETVGDEGQKDKTDGGDRVSGMK
jgi:hypothetical protein